MATICYHDIGDYLSREEKLKRIRINRSALGGMEWVTIIPNEKNDWINQRDGVFDSMFLLGDKENKENKRTFFVPIYARGIGTSRDAWAYNFSKVKMLANMKRATEFFNGQLEAYVLNGKQGKVEDFINNDDTKISWSRAYRNDIAKGKRHLFDEKYSIVGLYRPYTSYYLYYDKTVLNDVGPIADMFPSLQKNNIVICMSSVGDTKDFTCLITCFIPDLHLVATTQCFPLYYYEENKNKQRSLFDEETNDDYIRRDGITDWILNEVRTRYGTRNITKEMIFYYVYGLLHSKDYRERFAADLKKSLPRIPIVDSLDDFMDFYRAGKRLADLHLNYETVAPYPDVLVRGDRQVPMTVEQDPVTGGFIEVPRDEQAYNYFRVVDKMRFRSKDDKSVIIYNGNITIENIPQKAYDYVVNGKSAIEWVVERYAVTQDKKSLIKNDANDWAREHHKPRYILDLLLSVINVSVQTVDIVNSLPKLKFD